MCCDLMDMSAALAADKMWNATDHGVLYAQRFQESDKGTGVPFKCLTVSRKRVHYLLLDCVARQLGKLRTHLEKLLCCAVLCCVGFRSTVLFCFV